MIDGAVVQTFGTLMVLSLLLGLGILFLKKFTKKSKQKSNALDIQIISKISIQPKTSIIVVKAGMKTLLIGTTDHNISILADLTEDVKYMQNNSNRKSSPSRIGNYDPVAENQNLVSADDVRRALLTNKNQPAEPSLSFGSFLKTTFSKSK
jgi:flagellar biogenesis protein FliO